MSSLNSAWTTICNPDTQGPTSSALTQMTNDRKGRTKSSRLASWQGWDLADTVSSPGIPILKTEAGAWIASRVIRNSSVSRRQLSPEVLSVSSSPFSLYLSFSTPLPLLVHTQQNESILQDPSAHACCLPVQMAPCDGSLLFHQETSQEEFVLHYWRHDFHSLCCLSSVFCLFTGKK